MQLTCTLWSETSAATLSTKRGGGGFGGGVEREVGAAAGRAAAGQHDDFSRAPLDHAGSTARQAFNTPIRFA